MPVALSFASPSSYGVDESLMKFGKYKFRILLSLLCVLVSVLPVVGIIITIAEGPNPFGFLLPCRSLHSICLTVLIGFCFSQTLVAGLLSYLVLR